MRICVVRTCHHENHSFAPLSGLSASQPTARRLRRHPPHTALSGGTIPSVNWAHRATEETSAPKTPTKLGGDSTTHLQGGAAGRGDPNDSGNRRRPSGPQQSRRLTVVEPNGLLEEPLVARGPVHRKNSAKGREGKRHSVPLGCANKLARSETR